MRSAIPDESLDQIFRTARTFNGWLDAPIEEAMVRKIYDLLKWGPTSAKTCPARFVWVRSPESLEMSCPYIRLIVLRVRDMFLNQENAFRRSSNA